MAIVTVRPLPTWMRTLPARLWSLPPPLFDTSSGPIDATDREFAEALLAALDDESRQWYGRP